MISISDKLSRRMYMVVNMVTKGKRVADIGCDHAFVSIYLVQNNIAPYVIAMDVRKGPLAIAQKNIKTYHTEKKIDLRLSDGFESLLPDETDTAVIAGMGGPLIIRLLEQGCGIIHNGYELILQPQSEIAEVRKYLRRNSYAITREEMLWEDGNYYTALKAVKCKNFIRGDGNSIQGGAAPFLLQEVYDLYGEYLIREKSAVLKEYLLQESEKLSGIYHTLCRADSEKSRERLTEVEKEMKMAEYAISLIT